MKIRAFTMLGVAIALGLGAVWLSKSWLKQASVAVQPSQQATTLVVARSPLNFGNRIGREHLQEVAWPSDAVPAGSFHKIEDVLSGGEDRYALRAIEPYEPIMAGKISERGGRATLSTILDKNKRAITIRINDVLGVAGFVLPGDRVDVLVTRQKDPSSRDDQITDILLQNIKVLGIDQDADERKDKPTVARAATLEVTPDEAQKLTLGSKVGVLGLALRNQADGEFQASRTVTIDDLRVTAPAEPAPIVPVKTVIKAVKSAPPRVQSYSVNVIRGLDSSEVAVNREAP